MKARLLFSLLSASQLSFGLKPEDSRPIPKPTRPLEWGDVNVLHTTDIHGWVLGHPKQVYPEMSWSGTFGDFYSFLFHMRNKAKDKHADLFLVDTGDRRIGHGLTDKLLDPKTVNGQAIVEMYLQLGYDAIVPGNHDLANPHVVEFIMNKFADQWNGRFITSNIHRLQPQKTRTESSAPEQLEFLGAPYRYWKTKNKNKIMAFGVVLSKARIADKLISVMPVSKMITEDWFKGALTLPTDVFMIIGHIDAKNPLPQDDMKLIHDAIRRVHPLKPIIIFAGHSHQRYCNRFTTPKGSFRSMILQSGRYFDTVGWMSTKLDNNSIEQDLVMKRRYLDNNVETYKYHADKTNDNFYTRKGREIANYAYGIDRSEGLSQIYGYLSSNYYLDRKPWTEKEDDPESLFSLYLDAAENVLIDKEVSPNWMFFSNWGVLRGDIYSGPFTLGDFYTISPNDPNPYLHVTVKRSVADQVIQQLQSGGRSKLQWTSAESRDSQPHGSQLGQFAQRPLSAHSSDSNPSNNLTYGWKTRDHCGEKGAEVYGEGDDVEHEPIPQVSFDNEPPVFFWRKSYKDTNLADDADIDLIFTNYIGKKVPDALNKITNSTKFNKDSIREYPSEIKQDKLLGLYIRSKFNTITSNIPFPE
ncbi:Metallo-dependent phosphatase-like protein [Rhizoctonia solani]|nr:Metallo-dependent phosphatase-like protein [Rhizoctonia solani]